MKNFKIITIYFPTGWIAIAKNGLKSFTSKKYLDIDKAINDVKKQINNNKN